MTDRPHPQPPLPPSDFNLDWLKQWLEQQTLSFQKIITGSLQAGNTLSSSNFSSGAAGWQIDGDGNAEFNDVTIRGDIESGNWDGTSPANLSSMDSGATVGFYLDSSAGAAQFMGDMWIGGNIRVGDSTIFADLVADETLTISGSQTADSFLRLGGSWAHTQITMDGYLAAQLANSGVYENSLILSGPSEGTQMTDGAHIALIWQDSVDESLAYVRADNAWLVGDGGSVQANDDGLVLSPSSGNDVTIANGQLLAPDGAASAPTYSFESDTDTGPFRQGANAYGISAGGEEKLRVVDSGSASKFDFIARRGNAFVPMEVGGTDSGGSGFRVVRVPN